MVVLQPIARDKSFKSNCAGVLFNHCLVPPKTFSRLVKVHEDSYAFSHRYDQLFKWTPAHLAGLTEICPATALPVLDLGGGTGQVSEALVRQGHHVVLVDKSPEMLRSAKIRLNQMREDERKRLVIFQQDMRQLKLDNTFGYIFALGGPLTFLQNEKEIIQTLKTLRSHIHPDGFLFLDYFNADYWSTHSAWKQGRWQYWFKQKIRRGYLFTWLRTFQGPQGYQIEFDYALTRTFLQFRKSSTLVTFFSLEKWLSLLRGTKFDVEKLFCSWQAEARQEASHPSPNYDMVTIKARPIA